MDRSPAIEAASQFLSTVWDGEAPSGEMLLAALDRLLAAYHATPDALASETDLEAPRSDDGELRQKLAARFPDYGYYQVSDPAGSLEDAVMIGDAIDDLLDLTLDMREVAWLAEQVGPDDAHWSFRLNYFHWGRHARELGLYLHARQFE